MQRLTTQAVAAVSLVLGSLAGPASALTPTTVASGLSRPVFLTAPANDPRLFVVEQAGMIKVLEGGAGVPWFDLTGKVNATGERGLLGLAFDPNFATNGHFYVNYIDRTSLNTVVERYSVANPATGTPDPASARPIIGVAQPAGRSNHKAGWIGFRPGDPGSLYIATGDGGGSNDPDQFAQNLSSNLGKILRVAPGADGGYSIPASNPFADAVAGNDEIWSYGLRNPYRASFDRTTGDFWIADVGQNTREEVNLEAAGTPGGRNYGWRALEGSGDNPGVADPAPPGAVGPLFDYLHPTGDRSIIGGYVYRGGAEAGLDGLYVFGDFVSGKMYSGRLVGGSFTDATLRSDLAGLFAPFQLTSFGEDSLGGLYAMGLNGRVYLIAAGVPEPGTYALFAAGLLALGAVVVKRRQRFSGAR